MDGGSPSWVTDTLTNGQRTEPSEVMSNNALPLSLCRKSKVNQDKDMTERTEYDSPLTEPTSSLLRRRSAPLEDGVPPQEHPV